MKNEGILVESYGDEVSAFFSWLDTMEDHDLIEYGEFHVTNQTLPGPSFILSTGETINCFDNIDRGNKLLDEDDRVTRDELMHIHFMEFIVGIYKKFFNQESKLRVYDVDLMDTILEYVTETRCWIRTNTGTNSREDRYYAVTAEEPTQQQYESLITFFDDALPKYTKPKIAVYVEENFIEFKSTTPSEDIIDTIKHYYRNGEVIESILKESKADQEKLLKYVSDGLISRNITNSNTAHDVTNYYLKIRQNLKSPQNDIYYWLKKPFDEFADFIAGEKADNDNKKAIADKEKSGATVLYKDKDWLVLHITNYEAAAKYGKNTKWCITGSNRWNTNGEKYWNDYHNGGVSFYFFITHDEKYAIAVYPNNETKEIFNSADQNVSYIPNAPLVKEIPVTYTKDTVKAIDILSHAIMTNKMPLNILNQVLQSYLEKYNFDFSYFNIHEINDKGPLEDFLDAGIPEGFVEYQAVINGKLSPEEYNRITGEDRDPEWFFDSDFGWDGDWPTLNMTHISFDEFKTKKEAVKHYGDTFGYEHPNFEYYILLNGDDGDDVIPCKDFVDVFREIVFAAGFNEEGHAADDTASALGYELLDEIREGRIKQSVLDTMGIPKETQEVLMKEKID